MHDFDLCSVKVADVWWKLQLFLFFIFLDSARLDLDGCKCVCDDKEEDGGHVLG